MENSEKIEKFRKELDFIKNSKIKEFAEKAVSNIPAPFFGASASSSGRYHPQYALGDGGLLRHTVAATRLAVELFRMEMFNYLSDDEKDMIIVALILHDSRKSGKDFQLGHTVFEHPLLAAEAIEGDPNLQGIIPDGYVEIISACIKSHMGSWNVDKYSDKVLPKPKTNLEKIVHMADYLASRKTVLFDFTAEVKRE